MRRSSIVNFSDIAIGTKISMRDAGSDIWKLLSPKDGPEKILFAIALQDIFRVSSISQKRSGSNHKSREKTQLINYNYNKL